MAERQFRKLEVAGSTPVGGSMENKEEITDITGLVLILIVLAGAAAFNDSNTADFLMVILFLILLFAFSNWFLEKILNYTVKDLIAIAIKWTQKVRVKYEINTLLASLFSLLVFLFILRFVGTSFMALLVLIILGILFIKIEIIDKKTTDTKRDDAPIWIILFLAFVFVNQAVNQPIFESKTNLTIIEYGDPNKTVYRIEYIPALFNFYSKKDNNLIIGEYEKITYVPENNQLIVNYDNNTLRIHSEINGWTINKLEKIVIAEK